MQAIPKIAVKAAAMPEFGSFIPPRTSVARQVRAELALVLIVAIVLVAIVLQA
ncbi:hypothetical protein HGP14_02790 [Rhizobium sp. P32RR-XVIII]|uniref:hypothetical protein n=1 Tax=Rhizobium sp. P32RR-XVIII TaxID=2726738 RepID=UPI0014577B52|nr:hypothetical protein [Rhizobium sp. P32RR-XVIII]NLS02296.1 hypothetical protein [Rhizobium sp. P32RR-XVIII]